MSTSTQAGALLQQLLRPPRGTLGRSSSQQSALGATTELRRLLPRPQQSCDSIESRCETAAVSGAVSHWNHSSVVLSAKYPINTINTMGAAAGLFRTMLTLSNGCAGRSMPTKAHASSKPL